MSATDTNVERQARRHRFSIVGIAAALVAALLLIPVIGTFGADPTVNEAGSSEPLPQLAGD